MFERFTDGARRAIVMAQEECRVVGDGVISTDYLLLGMLPDPDIQRVLDRAWASEDRIREQSAAGRRAPRRSPASGHIPFSPHAKQTLEGALRESQRLQQDWIGPAHLLLALLALPESSTVRTLGAAGIDLGRLTAAAEEVARQTPPPDDIRRAAHSGPRRVRRFPGALAEGDEPTREQYLALLENYRGLAGQSARLVRALDRYGRHDAACQPEQGCSCGLQTVLDGLAGPGPAAADG